ncbi:MAG: metal ABC transporter permease [Rhodospirillaceae bacterium]|nr:metal ABC transporter permease [Rhodospirillales bacterium]
MDEFLARALAGGLGLALVAGPFGCFVVWRRMAYFGDTLAHAALLGVVLGVALDMDFTIGIALLSLAVALLLGLMQRQRQLASDTMLGIISHGALATGLVALALMQDARVNLMGWLLGDILAIGWTDVAVLWGGGVVLLAALAVVWPTLVAMIVDEDLAAVEGHAVARARMVLMVLVALVVAAAMKVVGILLVTALLVIPAATARKFSRTPEHMAVLASVIGALAVALGLAGSWRFDTPSGPSVVVAAVALFVLSQARR